MPWKLVIYSQFFELNCVKFAVCPSKWENCQSCHLFILATSKSAGKKRWTSLANTLDKGRCDNRVEWEKRRTEKIFRSFPCCPKPLFQSEAKCEAIDMKMSFILNKTRFHKKGFTLNLVLKVRVFGTRKWPILPVLARKKNSLDIFVV